MSFKDMDRDDCTTIDEREDLPSTAVPDTEEGDAQIVPPEGGFDALHLMPQLRQAVDEMGFEAPTDIQSQAIPMLREGLDVVARSQTGTGKTMAFAIPAVEMIDPCAEGAVQVLILCPTRELAQQGAGEIKKLTRYLPGIVPVAVYGGAAMDRQILQLRRANLVIGTPGRIMDHMRRGTLTLNAVRLVVLDEADEMLSMGFLEDIEAILSNVPEARQTVLFSATMPDPILELSGRFMRDAQLVEINKAQVTLDQIRQMYMEVPMGRKLDALNLLIRGYEPVRTMIFCNTKLMVDEVSAFLNRNGFACEGIHGDMNQSQRTRVMEGFKSARIPILVATDVAARGIDVNDIDYVVNYDIPQNSEIYVHRIGRTGRAGKAGNAITLCSGRRQFFAIRDIGRAVKTGIEAVPIPTVAEIRARQADKDLERLRDALAGEIPERCRVLVGRLMAEGHESALIASAAIQLCFVRQDEGLSDIELDRRAQEGRPYRKLILSLGRRQKIAPNHVVSAIASRANIRGSEIGKIEIYDEKTIVGIPAEHAEAVAAAMQGATICGLPVRARLSSEPPTGPRRANAPHRPDASMDSGRFSSRRSRYDAGQRERTGHASADSSRAPSQERRGKVRLSEAAKAKLLDTSDLSRFEVGHSNGEHRREDAVRSRRNQTGPRFKSNADGRRARMVRGDRKPQRKHHS